MTASASLPTASHLTGPIRSERFCYDGARQIQEIVTDTLATVGLAEDPEGEANNRGLGEQQNNSVPPGQQASGDPEGALLSFEQSQMQQQENSPQIVTPADRGEESSGSITGTTRLNQLWPLNQTGDWT